jgi:Cdc6-like AAA superfamily ATPase
VQNLKIEKKQEELRQWLSPPDPSINLNDASEKRSKGSGSWFLDGEAFSGWKVEKNSFLWLYGIPGCGKSVLSSTIINNLKTASPSNPVLYFYFDFSDTAKQKFDGMLRSLIYQLYVNNQASQKHLESLFATRKIYSTQTNSKDFRDCFAKMVQELDQVWVVLDGMDECTTRDGLLAWVESLHSLEQANIHLLATSRPEHDIQSALRDWSNTNNWINIHSELVTEDIRNCVSNAVKHGKRFKRWKPEIFQSGDVQNRIVDELTTKANGM